jgi:hypothetical protein
MPTPYKLNSSVGLGYQYDTTLTAYKMHKQPRQRKPLTDNTSRVIVAKLDLRDKQLRLCKTGGTSQRKHDDAYNQTPAQKEEDRGAPSLLSLNTSHVRQLRFFTNELEPLFCPRQMPDPSKQSSPRKRGLVSRHHRCRATTLDAAASTSRCKAPPSPAYQTPRIESNHRRRS